MRSVSARSGRARIVSGSKTNLLKTLKNRTKTSSGKSEKKIINRGTRKYFKQMVVGSLIFFSAFLFLGVYSLFKYINQTFASASSLSSYPINEEKVVTLVFIETADIKADPVFLKSLKYLIFDKNNEVVDIFEIPLSLKVDMPGRYGEEEISKSFALGALNSKNPMDDGIQAVNNVVLKIFGYKIDRFILVGEKSSQIILDSLSGRGVSKILNIQSMSKLQKETISNLTLSEYYSIVKFAESVSDENIIRYAVEQSDIEDTDKLDAQILDLNIDGNVASEELNISVLNGTDYSGIATFGSRIITNAGGRVVGVSNAIKQYDTSYLVTDLNDSKTLSYLSRLFKIDRVLTKNEAQKFNESGIDRSDITVIVGFDIAEGLY